MGEQLQGDDAKNHNVEISPFDIAIVGMSAKTIGADSLEDYWLALKEGKELTRPSFKGEEDGKYRIGLEGRFSNPYSFDREFFNIAPQEALLMDPQHRQFLQLCYHALEHAGYGNGLSGITGLYASKYSETYLLDRVYPYLKQQKTADVLQAQIGNEKDHLCSYLAYKLGLNGPAITVQSACSSSLVAIHQACESLNSYQCDKALAGGVTISLWQDDEYQSTVDDLCSIDGHCRSYCEMATGTVYSNGMGVVVLKRLADAVSDGDQVYGVIKGSAVNNDAANRLNYMAPSAEGQVEVINRALSVAGVSASQLRFIEGHGTGTKLGDELELAALHRVFHSSRPHTCALCSVKSNIGHSGVAAGVLGLIKACLTLHHGVLPPQINNTLPHRIIRKSATPFYLNYKSVDLKLEHPTFAGVSSFGLGGTNAHVVLQSWPSLAISVEKSSENYQFPFSGADRSSLKANIKSIQKFLDRNKHINLAQASKSLMTRQQMKYRWVVNAKSFDELHLKIDDFLQQVDVDYGHDSPSAVLFLFPAEDKEFVESVRTLTINTSQFRDLKETLLQEVAGLDIDKNEHQRLFVYQVIIFRFFQGFGIEPDSLLGDGVGEVTAMYLSGVITSIEAFSILSQNSSHKQDNQAPWQPNRVTYRVLSNSQARQASYTLYLCGMQEPVRKHQQLSFDNWSTEQYQSAWYVNTLLGLLYGSTVQLVEMGINGEFSKLYRSNMAQLQKLTLLQLGRGGVNDLRQFMCELWQLGRSVNWFSFHSKDTPFIPLSPYPFKQSKYEIVRNDSFLRESISDESDNYHLDEESFIQHQWKQLFDANEPKKDDSVFEFGASSFSLLQLLNRINAQFELSLSLKEMYENHRFGEQVELIQANRERS